MFKPISIALFVLLIFRPSFAEDPAAKPSMTIAADKFPAGQDSPEGAACDLARAFIRHDSDLFLATCAKPYGGAETKKAYQEFLDIVVKRMKEEGTKTEPTPAAPTSIGKCFAARHLSKSGPASYGYAAFNFQDVMFVDVGVFLQNGKTQLTRTLVIKDSQGKWIVQPRPDLSPLLSAGLNEEPRSEQDFSGAQGGK